MNDLVFILDVDGVLTPGNFFYTVEGKVAKEFGPDDFDMLNEVATSIPLHFITGDAKGYRIVEKRLVDDCNYKLSLVNGNPELRWKWIEETYPGKNVIFMGDGCRDFLCLENAFFSITTQDALGYNKRIADYTTKRTGGARAVAEACVVILKTFNLPSFLTEDMRLDDI